MTELFAALFEFWGLSPVSPNLGYNMRGWDCESEMVTTSYYDLTGWAMLGISLLCFFTFYLFMDGVRFNQSKHWLIFLLISFVALFGMAFTISYNLVSMQSFTCKDYAFDISDCLVFGLVAGFWCAAFFFLWSLLYRVIGKMYPAVQNLSINTRNTPWKQ